MNSPEPTRLVPIAACALIALAVAALGCPKPHGAQVSERYDSGDELQPFATPYEDAFLIALGEPIPTKLTANRSEGKVEFVFSAYGAVQDREEYAFDAKSFRLVGNSTDTFDPGIPLLRYPLNVGDEWTWSGSNKFGTNSRQATAAIKTGKEKLNTVAGAFDTVRVDVKLSIESGSAKPVERTLSFWFAPKHGIVRREFEYDFTREPMPPKEKSDQP